LRERRLATQLPLSAQVRSGRFATSGTSGHLSPEGVCAASATRAPITATVVCVWPAAPRESGGSDSGLRRAPLNYERLPERSSVQFPAGQVTHNDVDSQADWVCYRASATVQEGFSCDMHCCCERCVRRRGRACPPRAGHLPTSREAHSNVGRSQPAALNAEREHAGKPSRPRRARSALPLRLAGFRRTRR
jgi:hypothetical protein